MSYSILIVDDDAKYREELCEALDDFDVKQAGSGAQAIEILKAPNEIDAVILDVMMPGMRGTDVLREMKKIAPNVAIIIMTGYSSKDVAVEALKGRADDYIEKPADMPKLIEIIYRAVSAREPALSSMDIKGKVERVKRFAERNFDKRVSLEEAAAHVSLSPKYLSRIFKQEAGMGFVDYRAEVKINKAKEMLEKTGYNVSQIADKLAYENAGSFIRAFKKSAGCTPSEYRSRFRGGREAAANEDGDGV